MKRQPIKLLDHGYLRLVETWGVGDADIPEAAIIEAARQSTQGSFRGWEEDEKLLGYLHRNKHSTPFEFAGATIEVQAPIFVFREWFTHRTQSRSEMSARYEPLPDLYYVPTLERCMLGKGSRNKQETAAKGAEELTEDFANAWLNLLEKEYQRLEALYQQALRAGIPKELARASMPVGHYSRMRVSANLRNWLHFLALRMSPNAQYEIRLYAEALGNIFAVEFPRTWKLFLADKSS